MDKVLVSDDSLGRVEDLLTTLSRAEKKLGQRLLKDPQWFIRENVRAIANAVGVSEPTVIRFCRNVGFEGFKDLKFQIAQELALRQALKDAEGGKSNFVQPSRVTPQDPTGLCEQVWFGASEVLDQARASVEFDQIEKAAQLLAGAKRIVVFGIGGSSGTLAEEMHNRLSRLSLPSATFTDSYTQVMAAATLADTDVAVFISSTGRPRSLLDSLELAKHYGAKTLGIAPSESTLGRDVDICLHVTLSQSGVNELQPNPMRYAQLFMIDCLAYSVALALGDSARTSLRRVRASVASLNGIAAQQPLGD